VGIAHHPLAQGHDHALPTGDPIREAISLSDFVKRSITCLSNGIGQWDWTEFYFKNKVNSVLVSEFHFDR
jgi:hypothetical protein